MPTNPPVDPTIKIDDLKGPAIIALLESHLDLMRSQSPPESVHALDLNALRQPSVTFWTAWEDDVLLGCGALKEEADGSGEIKSMHTAATARGRGVGAALLAHLEAHARARNLSKLNLETGATDGFAPARRLYAKFGYRECPPFGDYKPDPYSTFMTKEL